MPIDKIANETKVGRIGPRKALTPEQPNEAAFKIICNAQHDDDNNPNSAHHALRFAIAIIFSLIEKYASTTYSLKC